MVKLAAAGGHEAVLLELVVGFPAHTSEPFSQNAYRSAAVFTGRKAHPFRQGRPVFPYAREAEVRLEVPSLGSVRPAVGEEV